MANSDKVDLMGFGRHCAAEGCRQLDFLPFKCRGCDKVYCLEHRVCPCTITNENTVLVCPICARAVVCEPGSDIDVVFDRHTRTDCDPSNYDRVHRKQRCPVPGCKEKLTATNTYTCRDCAVTVCLKHRLPADHKCSGRAASAATAAQSRLNGLMPQSFRNMFSSSGGGGTGGAAAVRSSAAAPARLAQQAAPRAAAANAAAASRPTLGQKAAAVAAKTRESVQAQLQQYRQQQRQRGQPQAAAAAAGTSPAAPSSGGSVIDLTGSPAAAAAGGGGGGPELCQQCGARFANVQQLIEHAEAAHAAGWSSGAIGSARPAAGGGGAGGLERCPHCGQQFSDPVALVAHVERQHAAAAAGARETCVLC